MVTTCEITTIGVLYDEQMKLLETEDVVTKIAENIKSDLCADHIQILNNQLFIRDLPDQTDTQQWWERNILWESFMVKIWLEEDLEN